jgi:hypothetical protein
MMRIDNLIKRLEWAQSMGVTRVNIVPSPIGNYQIITGQTEDGEIKQIYPMSDEEKAQQKALKPVSTKPKKEIKFVNNDNWRYSERDDDFEDLDDDYFGNDIEESIEKIKKEFKRFL